MMKVPYGLDRDVVPISLVGVTRPRAANTERADPCNGFQDRRVGQAFRTSIATIRLDRSIVEREAFSIAMPFSRTDFGVR
jgi:hypothetical protein